MSSAVMMRSSGVGVGAGSAAAADDASSSGFVSYAAYKTIDTLTDTGCVGTLVRFDPFEELLWVGANEGYLQSYHGSYLTRYSGFSTQHQPVPGLPRPPRGGRLTDFCLTDAGPFVVTTNGIAQHKRDGALLFAPMLPNAAAFNCCLTVGNHRDATSSTTVIVAGNKGVAKKISLDRPDRVDHVQVADMDSILLRASDRFLCFGSANGEVGILDLRSNQVRRHRISPRDVVLYDFDVHDYSLFSCAYQVDVATGAILPSCSISAYDLRVCKSTSPITASLAPTLIRFLPDSCGQTCVVADAEGRYQFVDSVASSAELRKSVHQIDAFCGAVPFSMDVSSSGQGIAVADTAGAVHVLSSAQPRKPTLWNEFPRRGLSSSVPVVDQVPANDMLFPPAQRFLSCIVRETVPYNQKALTTGFVNMPGVQPLSPTKHGALQRSTSYISFSPSPPKSVGPATPSKMSSRYGTFISSHYIMPHRWEDVPESLPLAVLEPISLNSHINPVLQALFSMKSVSAFFQSHICFDEFCLTCELGFLFHMLSVEGSADSCQATNLVRVLRSLPDASERSLIVTGSQEETIVGAAVQNWMEFLLERTHSEYLHHTGYHESQESPVTQLCAWKVLETVMHECGHTNQLEKFVFCLPLQYSVPNVCVGRDLHGILKHSLNEHSEWVLTCAYCHQQTKSYVSRNILSSPETFTVSFNLEGANNKALLKNLVESWSVRQTLSREKSKSPLTSEVKPCRYGASCTRPNCFFLHPNEVEEDQGSDASPTFIPPYIWTRIDGNGQAEVVSHQPLDSAAWSCYEATTIISENVAYGKDAQPTVTCAVKVKNAMADDAVWQSFDDLVVTPITQHAALSFDLNYKIPCTVQYARVDMELRWPTRVMNPINRDIFQKFCDLTANRRCYQTSSVVPVQRNEVFNSDCVVALDAEFVSLAEDDSIDLASAVAASTAKPSVLSVGRVTAVRGNGHLTDTLLMDEYVVARDKVANHLTEFSGIRPGDLSANLSLKRLDTLKSVYVRLRYLVDSGVHFIGHGIHTDFRILNIRVPADQIIDTVQLYRLPDQRLISLKFLSWYFLGNHIQHLHGHDSAEDALTALRLYNLYEKYRSMAYADLNNSCGSGCTFVDLLAQMYELGRSLQWKVPPPQNP
ncbi:PAB-dependent poly(A)-specific ribonuclease subunit PAN2 [Hypsibius exemplaris]|uniref:PAB-dependent poly(A)-specific ribonuclease subunit PAN2 n=1 Tax=Hypsibius exemplaris TaxID=2072580 RepID=A0A1W0WBS9_HYPEX|nr:PAB-dependent poly(A)-specific ribonuclease subunit PAN2 [Hypsibius exemplaris]